MKLLLCPGISHLSSSLYGPWPRMFGAAVVRANAEGKVELNCQDVIRGISEYLDHEIGADLRQQMEQHFSGCQHCTAILDGTRNVIALVGDGRSFLLPAGFSERLRERLTAAR